MTDLLKVSRSEIKAKLDEEKKAKAQAKKRPSKKEPRKGK